MDGREAMLTAESLGEAVALAKADAAGDITVASEVRHRNVRVAGDSDLLLGVVVTATAGRRWHYE